MSVVVLRLDDAVVWRGVVVVGVIVEVGGTWGCWCSSGSHGIERYDMGDNQIG